jgi:hypothetical protein
MDQFTPRFPKNYDSAAKTIYLLDNNGSWNGSASTKDFPESLHFAVVGDRAEYTDAGGGIVACSSIKALQNVFPNRDLARVKQPIQPIVKQGSFVSAKEGVALTEGGQTIGTLPFSPEVSVQIHQLGVMDLRKSHQMLIGLTRAMMGRLNASGVLHSRRACWQY